MSVYPHVSEIDNGFFCLGKLHKMWGVFNLGGVVYFITYITFYNKCNVVDLFVLSLLRRLMVTPTEWLRNITRNFGVGSCIPQKQRAGAVLPTPYAWKMDMSDKLNYFMCPSA